MKRLLLLLYSLLLVLLVACQAPTPQTAVTERSQPASTTVPAKETDVPATAATETVAVPAETPSPVEPVTDSPTQAAETSTPEVMAATGFDYLVDPYYDESDSWQLRGAHRTASGWESALVSLSEPVSIGGVDYFPARQRALIWDHSGNQGAGPSNLAADLRQ